MCIFDVCIFITPCPLIIMYTDLFFSFSFDQVVILKDKKKRQIFYGFTIGTWSFVFNKICLLEKKVRHFVQELVTSVDIVILTCDSLKVKKKKKIRRGDTLIVNEMNHRSVLLRMR